MSSWTKKEKIMKKKPLSEISINATTLAGKAATFYDHQSEGLGAYVPNKNKNLTELNNPDLKTGFYFTLSTAENKPTGTSSAYVLVLAVRVGLLVQIFINSVDNRTFVRSYTDGIWSQWSQL